MPRRAVSNEAWFTEKQLNCLFFINTLCGKYKDVVPGTISLDSVSAKVDELLESNTKRNLMFSAVARKQLVEGIPAFEETVKAAKAFYGKPEIEKSIQYDNAICSLKEIHEKFGEFIEFLDANKDEVLPDVDKLAGYATLFFGDFIKNT